MATFSYTKKYIHWGSHLSALLLWTNCFHVLYTRFKSWEVQWSNDIACNRRI